MANISPPIVISNGQFLLVQRGGTLQIDPGGIFVDNSAGNGFVFTSEVLTGDDTIQAIPHGLGGVPSGVIVSPYDNFASQDGLMGGKFSIEEFPPDDTNIYVRATDNLDYKCMALKF